MLSLWVLQMKCLALSWAGAYLSLVFSAHLCSQKPPEGVRWSYHPLMGTSGVRKGEATSLIKSKRETKVKV